MSRPDPKEMKRPNFIPLILLIIAAIYGGRHYLIKTIQPALLKAYIATATGNCQTAPIFCTTPGQEITVTQINKEFLQGLTPYSFADIQIRMPKDFTVTHEKSQRVYYKKWKRRNSGAIAFLLNQPTGYFIHLFPEIVKRGVKNNYDFLDRTMSADLNAIKDTSDAFFVIVKGIFIPDIGDQKTVKMIKFNLGKWRGFMNYNLGPASHYFDCNIITENGEFIKVYIKDIQAKLDLDKVFTILSTMRGSGLDI